MELEELVPPETNKYRAFLRIARMYINAVNELNEAEQSYKNLLGKRPLLPTVIDSEEEFYDWIGAKVNHEAALQFALEDTKTLGIKVQSLENQLTSMMEHAFVWFKVNNNAIRKIPRYSESDSSKYKLQVVPYAQLDKETGKVIDSIYEQKKED